MSGVILSLLVPVLLCIIAVRLWAKFVEMTADSTCSLPLPPGSVGIPFIGDTFELAWKGYSFFRERRASYGQIYKTHIMGRPTIRVFGSENIKKILTSEEVYVTMQWPTSVRMLIGHGSLMCSSGELHSIRRKGIMKAFTEESIAGFLPHIQETVQKHLQQWCAKGTILGQQESRYLSADLASRCLLGYEFSQRELLAMTQAMADIEAGFFSLPYDVPLSPLGRGMRARCYMLSQLDKAVKKAMESPAGASHDAISSLLKSTDEDKLTVDEIKDSCMEMLFSAHEGISSAVCTMLLEVGRHPYSTEIASQEIFHNDLMEEQRPGDLTTSKMGELGYIKRLVKEVLRMTPPMGGGYRNVLRTMEIDGYQVPKGWTLLYSIRDQHETGTDNSKQFDPDRWLPHRDVTRFDEYSYIPFGGTGRRSCIGEKFSTLCLEVMAVEVIRSCQWRMANTNPVMKYFPVPYPVDSLPMTFSPAPPYRQRRVTL